MILARALARELTGRVVLVGVGNPARGDDGAGPAIARRVAGSRGFAAVIDATDVPESHLGEIRKAAPDTILFADAVHLGSAAGAVALITKEDLERRGALTHRTPLALVMEYLERETGARTRVLAIQPRETGFGSSMSPEVEATVAEVSALLDELPVSPP